MKVNLIFEKLEILIVIIHIFVYIGRGGERAFYGDISE